MRPAGEITVILRKVNDKHEGALSELWNACYREIHSMSRHALGRWRTLSELQPTVVLHEAFVKLHGGRHSNPWQNRVHYFGSAKNAIAQILTDEARRRGVRDDTIVQERLREHLRPNEVQPGRALPAAEMLDDSALLERAFNELRRDYARVAEVVHLRVISDLTIEEIAEQLGVSRRTAQSDWSFGLAFLAERLNRN